MSGAKPAKPEPFPSKCQEPKPADRLLDRVLRTRDERQRQLAPTSGRPGGGTSSLSVHGREEIFPERLAERAQRHTNRVVVASESAVEVVHSRHVGPDRAAAGGFAVTVARARHSGVHGHAVEPKDLVDDCAEAQARQSQLQAASL